MYVQFSNYDFKQFGYKVEVLKVDAVKCILVFIDKYLMSMRKYKIELSEVDQIFSTITKRLNKKQNKKR